MNRMTLGVVFFVVLGAASCSTSPSIPTEEDGRKALDAKVLQDSDGSIRLISFKKTNGIERFVDGAKGYEMQYAAVVEFATSDGWGFFIQGTWYGTFCTRKTDPMRWDNHFRETKPGQQEPITGYLNFALTEQGWQLQNKFGCRR